MAALKAARAIGSTSSAAIIHQKFFTHGLSKEEAIATTIESRIASHGKWAPFSKSLGLKPVRVPVAPVVQKIDTNQIDAMPAADDNASASPSAQLSPADLAKRKRKRLKRRRQRERRKKEARAKRDDTVTQSVSDETGSVSPSAPSNSEVVLTTENAKQKQQRKTAERDNVSVSDDVSVSVSDDASRDHTASVLSTQVVNEKKPMSKTQKVDSASSSSDDDSGPLSAADLAKRKRKRRKRLRQRERRKKKTTAKRDDTVTQSVSDETASVSSTCVANDKPKREADATDSDSASTGDDSVSSSGSDPAKRKRKRHRKRKRRRKHKRRKRKGKRTSATSASAPSAVSRTAAVVNEQPKRKTEEVDAESVIGESDSQSTDTCKPSKSKRKRRSKAKKQKKKNKHKNKKKHRNRKQKKAMKATEKVKATTATEQSAPPELTGEEIIAVTKKMSVLRQKSRAEFLKFVDKVVTPRYEMNSATAKHKSTTSETTSATARCNDSRSSRFARRSINCVVPSERFSTLTKTTKRRFSEARVKKMCTVHAQMFEFLSAVPQIAARLEFLYNGFPKKLENRVLRSWVRYQLHRSDEEGYENCPGLKKSTVLNHCRSDIVELMSYMGVELERDAREAMLLEIQRMQKGHEISRLQMTSRGQQAFTRCDAKHVFESMPHGLIHALEIKALISLGITSGLRGVSLLSLRWDNMTVRAVPDSPMYQVTFTITKSKGIREEFYRTFEGTLTDNSPQNAVYHVVQHLRDIARQRNASLGDGQLALYTHIFPHRHEQYNNWLCELTRRCGYPHHVRFTLHSFRSGFLFDCVARAANTAEAFQNSSIVASWVLNNASCIVLYIKQCLQSVISCTRVANGNKIDTFDIQESDARNLVQFTGEGAVIKDLVNNPEALHHVKLGPVDFTHNQKLQLFNAELLFAVRKTLGVKQHRTIKRLKAAVVRRIHKMVLSDGDASQTLTQKQQTQAVADHFEVELQHCAKYRWYVRDTIEKALAHDQTLVESLRMDVQDDGKAHTWVAPSHPTPFFIARKLSQQEQRCMWTVEETEFLINVGITTKFQRGWCNVVAATGRVDKTASQCNGRFKYLRSTFQLKDGRNDYSGMDVAGRFVTKMEATNAAYALPTLDEATRKCIEGYGFLLTDRVLFANFDLRFGSNALLWIYGLGTFC